LAYPRSYAQRSSGTEATKTVPAELDGFEVRATGVAAFHAYIGELVGGINRCSLAGSLSSQPGQTMRRNSPPETEPAEQVGARPHPSGAETPRPGLRLQNGAARVSVALASERNAGAQEAAWGGRKARAITSAGSAGTSALLQHLLSRSVPAGRCNFDALVKVLLKAGRLE